MMLAKYIVDQTEREIGSSASYMTTIHELWSGAFWRLVVALTALRTKAPDATARGVAAVSSMLIQDCGPCLEISVRLALREGAERSAIEAVLNRRPDELSPVHRTVYDLSQAVYNHAPEVVELSEQVGRELGGRVRADVALTLAFAPIYPFLKRALGVATTHCVAPGTLLAGAHQAVK